MKVKILIFILFIYLQVQKCYAPEVCCRYPQETTSQNQIVTNIVKQTVQTTQYVPPQTTRAYVAPTTQRPIPSKEYLPQVEPQPDTQNNVYITPTTNRPYVAPTTQRAYVPPQTQRPITLTPYKAEQYIPPKDNYNPQPSNDRPSILYPTPKPIYGGQSDLSEPIGRPSTNQHIQRQQDASVPLPPVGCAAALNCTEIQFCTAEAVISKTPVILTEEQNAFRVPMTDCRDIAKGFTGKCCRDPDYTDPWPVGQLGQYNPNELGKAFDDGQYRAPNGARTNTNEIVGSSSSESKTFANNPNAINGNGFTKTTTKNTFTTTTNNGNSGNNGQAGGNGYLGNAGGSNTGFTSTNTNNINGQNGQNGQNGGQGFNGVSNTGFTKTTTNEFVGTTTNSGFGGQNGGSNTGFTNTGFAGQNGQNGQNGAGGFTKTTTSEFSGSTGSGGSGFQGNNGNNGNVGGSGFTKTTTTREFNLNTNRGSQGGQGFQGNQGSNNAGGFKSTSELSGSSEFSGNGGDQGGSGTTTNEFTNTKTFTTKVITGTSSSTAGQGFSGSSGSESSTSGFGSSGSGSSSSGFGSTQSGSGSSTSGFQGTTGSGFAGKNPSSGFGPQGPVITTSSNRVPLHPDGPVKETKFTTHVEQFREAPKCGVRNFVS